MRLSFSSAIYFFVAATDSLVSVLGGDVRRFSNFSTVFIIGPDWCPSFMAEQILLFNQLGITLPINAWVADSLWLCFLTNYWRFSRGQLAREEYRFLRVAIFCVFNVEISCLRRKNRISWQIECPMDFQLQTCQGNKHPLALINCLLLLVLINESIICCDHYISIIWSKLLQRSTTLLCFFL